VVLTLKCFIPDFRFNWFEQISATGVEVLSVNPWVLKEVACGFHASLSLYKMTHLPASGIVSP
jgi:hypothetical protein